MIYENENIIIRPFTKEDITARYRSWFNDPETTKYNSHGLFPYTPEQAEAFIKDLEGSTTRIIWAIINRKTGAHIGNISLQSINLHNRSAELAIVIGEAEGRGKGYGFQACELAIHHGFDKLGLNRIWTGTAITNIPMRRVCEKLGMQPEGCFREGMFLRGEYIDVIAYGLLREEKIK